ncbi:MAG: hypothetical protein ACOYMN_22380, partial [Roseimicrobium sp.]
MPTVATVHRIAAKLRPMVERVAKQVAESAFLQRWWKELIVAHALMLTLAAPFILKPRESVTPARCDRRLVILTPHNEKIRHEFGQAFARHWKAQTGETLYVDWRVGGTSEVALMIRSDFAAAFEHHWVNVLGHPWTHEVAASFANAKVKPSSNSTGTLPSGEAARQLFLQSNVGIGVDLFFGGG